MLTNYEYDTMLELLFLYASLFHGSPELLGRACSLGGIKETSLKRLDFWDRLLKQANR